MLEYVAHAGGALLGRSARGKTRARQAVTFASIAGGSKASVQPPLAYLVARAGGFESKGNESARILPLKGRRISQIRAQLARMSRV
jgi:hypothetical protein